jgi:hypothetical protein
MDKVLPHEVLCFYNVTVCNQEMDRAVQCMYQPVNMRRGIAARAACAKHDDFYRAFQ